jgi:rfaE bifunctional protein kinase chain/domain
MKKNRTVLVIGNFNVLHPGHIRLLRFAREQGQKLIVGVISDKLSGHDAHIPENLRLDGVKTNSLVDEAFIIRTSIEEIINNLKPDIIVKGKEHENADNPEARFVSEYGGRIVFSSGESFFSSTDLIKKELHEIEQIVKNQPHLYIDRHSIAKFHLETLINSFSDLRICVVGDLIIDEYITCEPLGMSQEDPTIVVTPIESIKYIGGAAIVAAHASGLGAKVDFISVSGEDNEHIYAKKMLEEYRVNAKIFTDNSRPTTLKQRYRSHGKTLLRVSRLHQTPISAELQDRVLKNFRSLMHEIDILIFSDFNYGLLTNNLVHNISLLAKSCNIFIAADSQSSSQLGDIGRYKNLDLITPTEREARISLRNQDDGLVVVTRNLQEKTKSKNILLKLGRDGILVHSGTEKDGWTDRIEALNSSPIDVSGAGDSLLVSAAMVLAAGGSIWEAGYIGSLAAAVQVSRVGNIPLRANEIIKNLTESHERQIR